MGYSEAIKKKAVKLYIEQKMSTWQVAKKLGVSQGAVSKWIKASKASRSQKCISKSELEKIVRWYRDGRKSTTQIGKRLNRDPSTIYRILRKAKVTIRKNANYTEADVDKAVRLHVKNNLSINEIAKKHIKRSGHRPDWQTVYGWLVERGVKIKLKKIS